MLLEEIPSRTKVLVDSNVFIYHFLGSSASCTTFLERAEREDIDAYTSTIVLAEIMHRLMIAEVVEKYDVEQRGAVRFLKENPEVIPTLEKCEDAVEKIPEFSVKILHVTVEAIFESRELRRRYLLMTNDSLNVYVMRGNQLYDIATNDGDFERVEDIRVWKPRW
jgi:Predicted nucleic acid-binding protein, contains PIN domain